MKAANIKVTIFSNNNEYRALSIPSEYNPRTTLRFAVERGRKEMNLENWEVAVVGDQLLTDILGWNRVAYYTILVDPLVTNDAAVTTFNRNVERMILNHL